MIATEDLKSSFDAHYGLEIIEASPDLMKACVPVRDQVKQPFGLVHGGVYASIAEAIASYGTWLAVKKEGKVVLGMANATSFLRPISSGRINAEARPLHRGKATWVWDVECKDDQGKLCAVTRMTVAIKSQER